MKTPRPQEYVLAALLIVGVIGPAIAGLCCHLLWIGVGALWKVLS